MTVELRHRWGPDGLIIEAITVEGMLTLNLVTNLIPWSELRRHVCPRPEDKG